MFACLFRYEIDGAGRVSPVFLKIKLMFSSSSTIWLMPKSFDYFSGYASHIVVSCCNVLGMTAPKAHFSGLV